MEVDGRNGGAEEAVAMEVDGVRAAATPLEKLPGSRSVVGDRVVREVDVLLCPRPENDGMQLYLLQYPLRPAWRPYELEQRCQEIRVKPKQSKVEVDLFVDSHTENYDQEAHDHLKITQQTLSSSRLQLQANYAIGLLRENELHLSPLSAVVQLRPSMKYLDAADERKRAVEKVNEEENEEEDGGGTGPSGLVPLQVQIRRKSTEHDEEQRMQSYAYLKQQEDAEAWVIVEPHASGSDETIKRRNMMISSSKGTPTTVLSPEDYVLTLMPGRLSGSGHEAVSQDGTGSAGLSRSFLETLPLDRRIHVLLSKGQTHILQFDRLMKLAPHGSSELQLLEVVQRKAMLVQGCWVAASYLRYNRVVATIRDYILLLFTKNRIVTRDMLEPLNVSKEILREILSHLAVQRGPGMGWEFHEDTDKHFIRKHGGIVKEQAGLWEISEANITKAALSIRITTAQELGNPAPISEEVETRVWDEVMARSAKIAGGSEALKGGVAGARGGGGISGTDTDLSTGAGGGKGRGLLQGLAVGRGKAALELPIPGGTMSEETKAALPGALREIFLKHNVCNLQFICQCLRERAISISAAPKVNPAVAATALAAAKAASAPVAELSAAICNVATCIDGIYFLQSLGNPTLDPFREVVVALLRTKKGASAGLRKVDLIEAAKIALKGDVPNIVYQKVLKELCYTRGGVWVLKPGDGRPS
ncbi:hypothetical protein CBR_g50913 [Chara braunii]|uniref:DNA-directed RNA polymerase III subunit RPC5 n=1 Tax=Chara braunii TaxID=69332 RepID=A0A388M7P7_CHABU|nr:hypothetical protein CBR_g50913 [Chara braunii]|eukprot:GBG90570.1 hypothetical protein CBR_g50913 [Chara braunii]